ncbi:ankyrin-1-like isoform X2 [Littorina saxatilis]|uniref:ankyrin-1-like isoform X2 n=1 Tax=Littorina saxatilis TaxID=31220 RepID=UPI0038B572D7
MSEIVTGNTADQLCYGSGIRRHLPPKYQLRRESRQSADGKMVVKPSLQDKDTIFKLAANPKYFDEIQKKLQTLDFNVNTECDTNGDFLLHIVCRRGLSQLPLIMALVKIQGADVELCNAEGETPLMLAAAAGNPVLCDVLMCLFGADPNKPNPNTGRTALHYAVEGNHRKTVECLIRRGADVNSEDHMGRRTDDVPLCQGTNDDCHEVIQFNRTRRMEALTERIRKGELEKRHLLPTDLFVVDDDGYTLVMTAAIYNKPDALEVLLLCNDTTIDAQHIKTGMTAVSIAAQMGNVEAVEVLLSRGANPAIVDMKNYLPLHYAVLNNQEKVVDAMLEYFPQCYCGLYMATRLCKRTSIHVKLKSAFVRRQEEIVTPKLLACAMNGAADELYQLLDDGDNINPKSGTGNWPLYLAVQNGHLDVVKLLFERGGDIRKRHSTTGETVLHIAAKMGHTEITSYLLAYCRQTYANRSSHRPSRKLMDINTTDANNRTPLQVAAEKGFSKIVELLLQHGATTALLDAGGQLITCPQYEGVRMQIESHRQQHTKDVVALITDRSKKAFEQLQKIWLPRFDHNLRTKQGDTPLMVACAAGKLQVLKFFLESAVYPPARTDAESDDDSDADSGVLDPGGNFRRRRVKSSDGEDLQASGVFSQSTEGPVGQLTSSGDFTQSIEIIQESTKNTVGGPGLPNGVGNAQRSLDNLLHDVNRPKGLYIFHDGLVSHVCAVNLYDGSTPLHRAVEHGDNLQLVKLLLTADKTCINIQNNAGLSPLHLACKLGRKKVIELLLASEEIDLNVRTLESLLPEETTTNKTIIRMVQKARIQHTGLASPPPKPHDAEYKDDSSSTTTQSITGSTVNFDKLHSRYEALRKEGKPNS